MATALLVIDAQVNMFEKPNAIYLANEVLETLNFLIRRARQSDVPVVYVQHNGGKGDPDELGTEGWEIHRHIAPRSGDVVVQKQKPDAFFETTLQDELAERGVKKLVIAGMQSEMCVDTTCRQAASRGYEVMLVQDGHSTFDSPVLDAHRVIAHHNDVLTAFAKVRPANEIDFV